MKKVQRKHSNKTKNLMRKVINLCEKRYGIILTKQQNKKFSLKKRTNKVMQEVRRKFPINNIAKGDNNG